MSISDWASSEKALAYLARADRVPNRTAGEAVLLDLIPLDAARVLDLGTGDGRLLALVQVDRPRMRGVALDASPAMLAAARDRFAGDDRIEIVAHDLSQPLPDLGVFDAVVSSFAIHHCADPRKRALYGEIFARLTPGGVFCNLEHVASATSALHAHFLRAMEMTAADEDRSNILLDVETQLGWLRESGYTDVDCLWKWLELALLTGRKPV